jgi:hypothetical protein
MGEWKKMKTIPELLKEADVLSGVISDESAVEVLMMVLKSRKSRSSMASKLREFAGTNKAAGAELLRVAAGNIERGKGLLAK